MRRRRTKKSLDGKTPTSARRSTRVSRGSIGGGSSDADGKLSAASSRLRKKNRLSLASTQPCQKWANVLRPPRNGVGFKTMKWVPLSELTIEERIVYDEEMQEKRKRMGKMEIPKIEVTPKDQILKNEVESNIDRGIGNEGSAQTLPGGTTSSILNENNIAESNNIENSQSMSIDQSEHSTEVPQTYTNENENVPQYENERIQDGKMNEIANPAEQTTTKNDEQMKEIARNEHIEQPLIKHDEQKIEDIVQNESSEEQLEPATSPQIEQIEDNKGNDNSTLTAVKQDDEMEKIGDTEDTQRTEDNNTAQHVQDEIMGGKENDQKDNQLKEGH